MDILTLKKAVKEAQKYTPSSPSGDWDPTKVSEALDILADSRIVEHGENENGEYWRWENGLQICMLSFDAELLSSVPLNEMYEYEKLGENVPLSAGQYGALRWNCPAQFSVRGYCNAQFVGRHITSFTFMSAAVRFHRVEVSIVDFDVRNTGGLYASGHSYRLIGGLMAVGRWK